MIWSAMQDMYPRVSRIYTSHQCIHLCYPCIAIHPCRPVRLHHPCISVHPPQLSPLPSWLVVVGRNWLSHYTSNGLSKLAWLRFWSPHDHGLQVHISQLAQLWHPQLHDNSLQVHISKHAQLQPPSSPNSGLQAILQTRLIAFLECISKRTLLWPPSVNPNMVNYCIQLNLLTQLIVALEWIFELTWLTFLGALRIPRMHRLQPVLIYSV